MHGFGDGRGWVAPCASMNNTVSGAIQGEDSPLKCCKFLYGMLQTQTVDCTITLKWETCDALST